MSSADKDPNSKSTWKNEVGANILNWTGEVHMQPQERCQSMVHGKFLLHEAVVQTSSRAHNFKSHPDDKSPQGGKQVLCMPKQDIVIL